MRMCWSPLSYVRGPPLSPWLSQIIITSLPLPAHLTRVLARLTPGADLAVLPGAHGHCALSLGHHRDTHLRLSMINVHFLSKDKNLPRGVWRMLSPRWLLCPSRTPRRSSRRKSPCPRSGRGTQGCRCPGQPEAKQ